MKHCVKQISWLVATILALMFVCGQAVAQNDKIIFSGDAKWKKRLGTSQRISSDLLRMNEEAKTALFSGSTTSDVDTGTAYIRHVGGLPEVEICLKTTDETAFEKAINFLQNLGMTITQSHRSFGRIYGTISLNRLDDLNKTPFLATIRPNYKPMNSVGTVTSEGDRSMHTDSVRTDYGVDGTGVTVGVISDSYNGHEADLSASISAGDLPGAGNPNGYTTPVTVLSDYIEEDASDEGRAMIEIVHDVAPGATLMFYTAFKSMADFAEAYATFIENGADVIVDDVGYSGEPFFQAGIIEQAAQAAVDQGVLVFSSAGNAVNHSIDTFYQDINPKQEDSLYGMGMDLHDFGDGVPYAAITIPPDRSLTVFMQWNESFDGTLGPGAATDLDLYLYDTDSGKLLGASTNSQGCSLEEGSTGGDPYEFLSFSNSSGETINTGLVVDRACGNNDGLRFKINSWSWGVEYNSALFSATTVYGHPAAEGVIAVGAVDYSETDAFNDPHLSLVPVEYFTSFGDGIAYYFDENGYTLTDAPVLRSKPDLAAPDGGATSVSGFESFYGTSAAAPHADALAALMLEFDASDPLLITDCMRAGAVDVGETGWDGYAGNGLVKGTYAMALLDAGGEGVYAIDASSSANGSISPTGRMVGYTPGTAVTLTAQDHTFTFKPDDYYHVEDVLINGISQGALSSYTFSGVTEDQTLRVEFMPDIFTISVADVTGGSIEPSGDVDITYEEDQTWAIHADTGYTLTDVLVDGKSVGPLETVSFSDTITNHTLSAVFTINTYTVTSSVVGSGNISPSEALTVDHGSSLNLTITADEDHHIEQVLINGEAAGGEGLSTYALFISQVNEDMVISVEFNEDKNGGGSNFCFISTLF